MDDGFLNAGVRYRTDGEGSTIAHGVRGRKVFDESKRFMAVVEKNILTGSVGRRDYHGSPVLGE